MKQENYKGVWRAIVARKQCVTPLLGGGNGARYRPVCGVAEDGATDNISYSGKQYSRTIGLTWNSQYQLTATFTNGAAAERFDYDSLGRRAFIWDGSVTNYLIYDGPHVIAEVDATGGLKRSYAYGPGIDQAISMAVYSGGATSAPNVYYYLRDHLGSVLALTDTNGAIVESYRYDAWGRTTVYDANDNPLKQSAVGNRICFMGREISWATGLYLFRARWYDPVTGRWLSNDPIGINGGMNMYQSFGNNPVCKTDPTGLCSSDKNSVTHALTGNVLSKSLKTGELAIGGFVIGNIAVGLFDVCISPVRIFTDGIRTRMGPFGWQNFSISMDTWDAIHEVWTEPTVW